MGSLNAPIASKMAVNTTLHVHKMVFWFLTLPCHLSKNCLFVPRLSVKEVAAMFCQMWDTLSLQWQHRQWGERMLLVSTTYLSAAGTVPFLVMRSPF